jgi:hypothetical protein
MGWGSGNAQCSPVAAQEAVTDPPIRVRQNRLQVEPVSPFRNSSGGLGPVSNHRTSASSSPAPLFLPFLSLRRMSCLALACASALAYRAHSRSPPPHTHTHTYTNPCGAWEETRTFV